MEKKLQKIYLLFYSLLIAHRRLILLTISEGLHRIKRKLVHDDKKCETYGIKY